MINNVVTTIINNNVNYLLNIVFYHILPVNHSVHKLIFLFNLGHVMFHDTDGHAPSNTAIHVLMQWKHCAGDIDKCAVKLEQLLSLTGIIDLRWYLPSCALQSRPSKTIVNSLHTLPFISQIRQGHYVGQCQRIVLRVGDLNTVNLWARFLPIEVV